MSIPELVVLTLVLGALIGILGYQVVNEVRAHVKVAEEKRRFLRVLTVYFERKNSD